MAKIIKKMIYFPRVTDPDFGFPQIIFVSRIGPHWIEGSRFEKMITEENRRKFFPVSRCREFTPEFWEKCEIYNHQRQEMDDQYQRFLK